MGKKEIEIDSTVEIKGEVYICRIDKGNHGDCNDCDLRGKDACNDYKCDLTRKDRVYTHFEKYKVLKARSFNSKDQLLKFANKNMVEVISITMEPWEIATEKNKQTITRAKIYTLFYK